MFCPILFYFILTLKLLDRALTGPVVCPDQWPVFVTCFIPVLTLAIKTTQN